MLIVAHTMLVADLQFYMLWQADAQINCNAAMGTINCSFLQLTEPKSNYKVAINFIY